MREKIFYNLVYDRFQVFKMESLIEEYAKDIYAMFSREVCLLSQLQNERIVKFHGFVATTVEFAVVLEVRRVLNMFTYWVRSFPSLLLLKCEI